MWIRIVAVIVDKVEKLYYFRLHAIYRDLLKVKAEDLITVIDVGAHKGESIRFFRKLFRNSEVYSFEPARLTFTILQKKYGGLEKVHLSNIAMGKEPGSATFYENSYSAMSSLIKPNHSTLKGKIKRVVFFKIGDSNSPYQVPISSLDMYFETREISHNSILKIDTEGTELEVLIGGEGLVTRKAFAIIQFEIHRDKSRGYLESEINIFLESKGYQLTHTVKHPSGPDVYDQVYCRN